MHTPEPSIKYHVANDGYRIATRVWEVERPIANVVCVHGIVSHGGWYLASGAFLANEGFAVHMPDRRGSGLNQTARGDVEGWETWLDDVELYMENLSPDVPKILLGISWGGTLSVAIARRRPDLIKGLGLLGPGFYSRQVPSAIQIFLLKLAGLVGLKQPRVQIPLQDPGLFTQNEARKAFIKSDPLALRKISLRFALANLALTEYAVAKPDEICVPTLAVLGEQDLITVNSQVREFVERINNESCRVIEYGGASHTLEFEPDPLPYFQDLAAWCREIANA